MKETQKLNTLIKKILNEEIEKIKEEDMVVVTTDGTPRTVTGDQKRTITNAGPGTNIRYKKPGQTGQMKEKKDKMKGEEDHLHDHNGEGPCSTCMAGEISEIIDKLKTLSEAPKDKKHGRHAMKAMKYMEAAKTALEGLIAHEGTLEEKNTEVKTKDAAKSLKNIEKHLSKVIRDKDSVSKIMKKMPVEKVLQMKDKIKQSGKEGVDEEKVAKAILNVALREQMEKKK
jgi:hypothetical protein